MHRVLRLAAVCALLVGTPDVAFAHREPPGPIPACGWAGSQRWLSTRASPLDSTTVTIRGATAKICYSRPSARGRSVDSLVPPHVAWRMGANEPAMIALTDSMNVGGAVLAAGRYVILAVPGAEQWTFVFHTTPDTEPAKMFQSLKRVAIGTGQVEHIATPVEQFVIHAGSDSAAPAFLLEWGTWRVRVPVRTVP
jgi:hypothetical protein